MSEPHLPAELSGVPVHLVGIKGTGMSALAEILQHRGARVTGSDTEEVFYTDAILNALGIRWYEGFDATNVPKDAALVVYSAAWDPEKNPELLVARARGIPTIVYTDALGDLSSHGFSIAIAGVHGKTTTTGMAGALVKALGLPGTVLAGSAVRDFGSRSTLVAGDAFFIAETCEYRRHFLAFHPSVAVITTVEPDHLDYFSGAEDVELAFRQLAEKLPDGGVLVYCADDPGAARVADHLHRTRPAVALIPYGETADGPFRRLDYRAAAGRAEIRLAGFAEPFSLALPGAHLALNATAALAAVGTILARARLEGQSVADAAASALRAVDGSALRRALSEFAGLARRSEIVGRARGILFMDDYGHHPTEIRTTLRGLREFYAPRRLIVDFMSHTYTRTDAFLLQFAESFGDADHVVLHDIYASARERYDGSVTGQDLADAVGAHHASVAYYPEVMAAETDLRSMLTEGDLFVTMGAGNNWQLSHALYGDFAEGASA